MRIYALAVYLFLYIPIGIIAVFSFNAGRNATQLQGFSANHPWRTNVWDIVYLYNTRKHVSYFT